MKTAIQFLAAAIVAAMFSSCCSVGPGHIEGTKTVTVNHVTSRTYDPGPKGGMPYEVTTSRPVHKEVAYKHTCTKCGSWYCPKPQCCDIVSKSVLARATAQGGTGEPHIGLIPTMKTLAPDED